MDSILIQFNKKEFDWQIIINSFGVLVTLLGVFGGVFTYRFQKNREYIERSLNEVYSPLYTLICRQEKLRELFFPNITIKEAPILTIEKTVTKETHNLITGEKKTEKRNEIGLLNRKDFIQALNDTNKGLASPELLRLITEYELLVGLEESLQENSSEWEKSTKEKVDVEYSLLKEIVRGYIDARKKLKLGSIKNINKYNL